MRAELATRLRARIGEIETAIFARVREISDPGVQDPREYAQGVRPTIAAAIEYGIAAVEHGEHQIGALPTGLRSQARLAARSRVALDSVLQRYFSGYTLLGDFLIEEAVRAGASGVELKHLLRAQAAFFERALTGVREEYRREAESHPGSSEEKRAERVRRLLRGETDDAGDLGYDFESMHVAFVVRGPGAAQAARELATPLDARLLAVQMEAGTVWAWLGAVRGFSADPFRPETCGGLPSHVAAAFGEPASGLSGWRLTHRQALAALPVAVASSQSPVRYADVALLAAALEDDLLAASLRDLYLTPLESERDGGEISRRTLRAYFAAEHHVSAAASALGVSRQTVSSRLRAIEERIGRPLSACAAELATALQLDGLYTRQVP